MKSIMYHYIKNYNPKMKYFNFLDVKNFVKQIEFFSKNYKIIDANDLFKTKKTNKKNLILTFDDGLKCHYKFVLPVLKKFKVNGIFYVPTLNYSKKKILDVHKIHLILGVYGATKSYEILNKYISKDMIDRKFEKYYKNFFYKTQSNHKLQEIFKYTLNFMIKQSCKDFLINKIFRYFFNNDETKIFNQYYLSKKNISSLVKNHMVIGSHGVTHTLLTRLSENQIKKEINDGFKFVKQYTDLKTFCFPYGGKKSYNRIIINHLKKKKVNFSFSVENRDISNLDLKKNRQILPRYDCNRFPFGGITTNKYSRSK